MKNIRALVIGLGISGRSAAAFLLKNGAHVTGVDSKREVIDSNPAVEHLRLQGLKAQHDEELRSLAGFNLVVVSPGVPHTHRLYAAAKAAGVDIVGEVELAFRFLKGTVLGITGTNGKTTVTLLIEHVLNHSGKKARALGNIGTPLTSELTDHRFDEKEIIVAELSSFQLETMHSKVIDAAVVLNVTPDHLDRYSGMDAYAQAKFHISKCLKPNGIWYMEQRCFQEFGHLVHGAAPRLYGYTPACDLFTDLQHLIVNKKIECVLPFQLQGKVSHDLENIMAAYAICRHVGVTPEQFLAALATFKKPAHRIQFVRTINGVSYYDDSKGTNIDAVIRAVAMLQGEIILIAGGVDKGAAYTPWIEVFNRKVKYICAIGQAAPKIKQDIGHAVPVELFPGLEQAVAHAARIAHPGDIVLLSPGCSSFDMFRDYAHRGEEFQRVVNNL